MHRRRWPWKELAETQRSALAFSPYSITRYQVVEKVRSEIRFFQSRRTSYPTNIVFVGHVLHFVSPNPEIQFNHKRPNQKKKKKKSLLLDYVVLVYLYTPEYVLRVLVYFFQKYTGRLCSCSTTFFLPLLSTTRYQYTAVVLVTQYDVLYLTLLVELSCI